MDYDCKIPRFIDYPNLYPVFTKGESLLVFLPVIAGWVATQSYFGLVVGLAIGATCFKYFRKFKEKFGEHVLKRWIYWHLPSHWVVPKSFLRGFPNSHVREYMG